METRGSLVRRTFMLEKAMNSDRFVVLTELYEKPSCNMYTSTDASGNIRTVMGNNKYSLRKIVINKENIILIRENSQITEKHKNDEIGLGLSELQEFTHIFLSCPGPSKSSITIVGSLSMVTEKVTGFKENV